MLQSFCVFGVYRPDRYCRQSLVIFVFQVQARAGGHLVARSTEIG